MPIERNIRFESVGNNNTVSRAFFNNYYADAYPVTTNFFEFDIPGYYTYGGTLDYYSQDPYAIFTNLKKPSIKFIFTCCTHNLSGDSYFVHNIYKLDYDMYKLYSDNQIANSQVLIEKGGSVVGGPTTPVPGDGATVAPGDGAPPISQDPTMQVFGSQVTANPNGPSFGQKSDSQKTFENFNSVNRGNNNIPVPDKFFGQPLTNKDLLTIQKYLSEPFVTITASTSAITTTTYDLYLDEYVKKFGQYKSQMFKNKGHYFIDTNMVFNVKLDRDYTSFSTVQNIVDTEITASTIITSTTQVINGVAIAVTGVTVQTGITSTVSSVVTDGTWNNDLKIISSGSTAHTISPGPFGGIQVRGNYFVYFEVPDKPVMEYPVMEGQLTTFTPEFRWSNGDKADNFVIQICYLTGNTGFTGSSVINYPVEKIPENSKTVRNKIKDTTTETETDKTIYNFQITVKSNSSFIWRVGNSVELIDIFNVRRNVVTFSDYYQAISQPEPIKTYVVSESDSPYVEHISGFITPPSLDYESATEEFTLSGTVSGSTVSNANMTLIFPNSSYINDTTDAYGNYVFTGLGAGTYTLITDYRGYQQDVRFINVTANTVENFKLTLLWGNNVDTWGYLSGDLFS